MRQKIHATIIGNYGCANYGDDVLLRALLSGLNGVVPTREILVVASSCEYIARWHPEVRVLPADRIGLIKTRFMLYGGGTQFFSFATRTLPAANIVARVARVIRRPSVLCRKLRACIFRVGFSAEHSAAISMGVGPFAPHSSAEKEAVSALLNCGWVSMRDPNSMAWAKVQGVSAVEHADLGFARDLWLDRPLIDTAPAQFCRRVGVIVRHWPHSAAGMAYFEPLCVAVNQMRNAGLTVHFISFAGEYDAPLLRRLRDAGENVLAWDPHRHGVADFAEQLRAFDLLVTARAHGLILGASLGIPSIAIELEPKLQVLREGLSECTLGWSAPFDPVLLCRAVDTLRANWRESKDSLSICAASRRLSAERSLAGLRAWMKSV